LEASLIYTAALLLTEMLIEIALFKVFPSFLTSASTLFGLDSDYGSAFLVVVWVASSWWVADDVLVDEVSLGDEDSFLDDKGFLRFIFGTEKVSPFAAAFLATDFVIFLTLLMTLAALLTTDFAFFDAVTAFFEAETAFLDTEIAFFAKAVAFFEIADAFLA